MRISFILGSLAAAGLAWKWDGAVSTKGYELVATGVSPVPTRAPILQVRDAAGGGQVCGYIGGNNNLPATCSPSSTCAWHTDWQVVGCCHTTGGCLFYTGCVDASDHNTDGDNAYSYTCTGTSTCYFNNYPDDYSQVGCGFSPTTVLLTYKGQKDGAATVQQNFIGTDELSDQVQTVTKEKTVTQTPSTSTDSSKTDSTSTQSSSTLSTSSSSADSSKTTSDPSSTSSNAARATSSKAPATSTKPGTSTGAIVGAAIGSLAFGAIVAGLIAWFLLRRKRKNKIYPVSQEPMSMWDDKAPHHGAQAPPVNHLSSEEAVPKNDQHPDNTPSTVSQMTFSSLTNSQYGWHPAQVPSPNPNPNVLYPGYRPYRPPGSPEMPQEMDGSSFMDHQLPQSGPPGEPVRTSTTMPEVPDAMPSDNRT